MINIISNIQYWLDSTFGIAGAIGGLFLGILYFKKKYDEIKEKKEQNFLNINCKQNNKHTTIHDLLISLRLHLNADRVQLAQFHNGGKFLDGSSIKRFSVTHESCAPGVSMESVGLQNVLISIFWFIVFLLKENNPKIRLTRNLSEDSDSFLKIYNESKGIGAFSIIPIKNQQLFLGFIRADWNNINEIPDDYEDCERLMEKYGSFVELELLKGD